MQRCTNAPSRLSASVGHRPIDWRCAVLFLSVLLTCASALPADDTGAQKATMQDLRTLGTGLMAWLTDQATESSTASDTAGSAPREEEADEEEADPNAPIELVSIPVVGREELEALLVPTYLPEIPEQDGWGNAYEVRLHPDAAALVGRPLIAIRSGGADGLFDGASYDLGAYPRDQASRDIVWVDGYFVRYPEP
ncbi:MAG TPA: hypothetical protein VMT85_24535 [Thermoanaerobaculia bacterium]|nr:hypothetical protein [Thermoanaerobaculia bacterium]